mmetsp:Transcript_117912/g.231404  ORF Transcript_117912/g.231404 Transcript_117912/m.231404 type:complete len:381 (-) Transcript_117912:260-1402(-)
MHAFHPRPRPTAAGRSAWQLLPGACLRWHRGGFRSRGHGLPRRQLRHLLLRPELDRQRKRRLRASPHHAHRRHRPRARVHGRDELHRRGLHGAHLGARLVLRQALFRTSPAVDLADVASVWFNTFLLAQYVGGILGQLGGGSACNFVLLSTSFAYPPVVFAWTRVSDTIAKMLLEYRGDVELCLCHWPLLVVLFLVPFICQVAILIAMIIACFWAVIGFVHIFLFCALGVALFAALWAAPVYLLGKKAGLDSDLDDIGMTATFFVIGRIVLCTMSVGSLFFCTSFFLYFHGDWLSFHNAFFDSAFAWPDPPSFSISTLRLCWELYLEVLTFQYVAPAHLMQLCFCLALIESLSRFVLAAVTKGVNKAVECKYPNSSQAYS